MKQLILFSNFLLLVLLSYGQMGYNADPAAHGRSAPMNGYIPALPMAHSDFQSAKLLNSKIPIFSLP